MAASLAQRHRTVDPTDADRDEARVSVVAPGKSQTEGWTAVVPGLSTCELQNGRALEVAAAALGVSGALGTVDESHVDDFDIVGATVGGSDYVRVAEHDLVRRPRYAKRYSLQGNTWIDASDRSFGSSSAPAAAGTSRGAPPTSAVSSAEEARTGRASGELVASWW